MAYAIIRMQKQKTGSLKSVSDHNRRAYSPENADSTRSHQNGVLIGDQFASTADAVNARLAQLGITKHRKDAVVAVEIMCSASPEFFRPDAPEKWGHWDQSRTDAWTKNTMSFLQKKYGDNLVEAILHLDEATPHIHAVVVPAQTKTKSMRRTKAQIEAGEPSKTIEHTVLCAKNVFNRNGLIALQDEYASVLKPLGLERGVRKSKSKHEKIRNYYGNSASDIFIPEFTAIEIPAPPLTGRDNWAMRVTKMITVHYQKQFEVLRQKCSQVWARARDYEKKYKRERARNLAYSKIGMEPDQIKQTIDTLSAKNDQLQFQNEFLTSELSKQDVRITQLLNDARRANVRKQHDAHKQLGIGF